MYGRKDLPSFYPVRGRSASRIGHVHLRRLEPLLCGRGALASRRRAPPPHLEAVGSPHQVAGNDFITLPSHETYL